MQPQDVGVRCRAVGVRSSRSEEIITATGVRTECPSGADNTTSRVSGSVSAFLRRKPIRYMGLGVQIHSGPPPLRIRLGRGLRGSIATRGLAVGID